MQIHSKKRNRLEHQRLQDLVYIKYNQALKERFNSDDLTKSIELDDFLEDNEWVVGVEEEFWDVVGEAIGAEEPLTGVHTRSEARHTSTTSVTRPRASASARARDKRKEVMIEDMDDEEEYIASDESEEEEEEYYNESD